jgi:hypothetical protein
MSGLPPKDAIKELFDFEGWDELDTMAWVFYSCRFKAPPGEIDVLVESVVLNLEKGTAALYDDGDEEPFAIFRLSLQMHEEDPP